MAVAAVPPSPLGRIVIYANMNQNRMLLHFFDLLAYRVKEVTEYLLLLLEDYLLQDRAQTVGSIVSALWHQERCTGLTEFLTHWMHLCTIPLQEHTTEQTVRSQAPIDTKILRGRSPGSCCRYLGGLQPPAAPCFLRQCSTSYP